MKTESTLKAEAVTPRLVQITISLTTLHEHHHRWEAAQGATLGAGLGATQVFAMAEAMAFSAVRFRHHHARVFDVQPIGFRFGMTMNVPPGSTVVECMTHVFQAMQSKLVDAGKTIAPVIPTLSAIFPQPDGSIRTKWAGLGPSGATVVQIKER